MKPVRSSCCVLGAVIAAAVATWAPSAPGLVMTGVGMAEPTNYVGWWRGATGVAVGPRQVVSARHLAGSAGEGFQLDGQWYTALRVINHPQRDIAIVVLDRDLPGWHNIAPKVRKGERVLMAGLGRGGGVVNRNGVSWSDTRYERWGENVVKSVKNGVITTCFDKGSKGLAHEANFAHGDSGGGVFVIGQGGTLQLAGIAVGADGDGYTRYKAKSYAVDITSLTGWIAANQ